MKSKYNHCRPFLIIILIIFSFGLLFFGKPAKAEILEVVDVNINVGFSAGWLIDNPGRTFQKGTVDSINLNGQVGGGHITYGPCLDAGFPARDWGHIAVVPQSMFLQVKDGSGSLVYDEELVVFDDWYRTSIPLNFLCSDSGLFFDPGSYFVDTNLPVSDLPPGNYRAYLVVQQGVDGPCPTAEGARNCTVANPITSSASAMSFNITPPPPPPGTVIVNSKTSAGSYIYTCWNLSGPSPQIGCGTSVSYYPSSPGSYSITADSQTGFTGPSISVTPSDSILTSGGTLTFNLIYTGDTGTIQVNSNMSTTWAIGGAAIYSGSGTSQTITNAPAGTYSLSPTAISGYSVDVYASPADFTLTAGGTLTFSIIYTSNACSGDDAAFVSQNVPSTMTSGVSTAVSVTMLNNCSTTWTVAAGYKLGSQNAADNTTWGFNRVNLPASVAPGDTVTFSFNITPPATPGTYNFQWKMIKGANGWFGNPSDNVPVVVEAAPNALSFTITYTAATLNTPSITKVDNKSTDNSLACNTLKVYWSYVPNGVEESFSVWRSEDNVAAHFTLVSDSIASTGASSYSWVDNNSLTANHSYYYKVQAHTTIGGTRDARSTSLGPTLNTPCSSMIIATMSLSKVNGASYNSQTIIKNNDVLTFQITLSNQGNTAATINYICNTPSANITNLRSLAVTGTGSSGSTITPSGCGAGVYKLNVSGSKAADSNNWLITYDATFVSQTSDPFEICSDTSTVNYTDQGVVMNTNGTFGPILCKTSRGVSPNFREVAP